MKVTVEFKNRNEEEFENVNYINDDFEPSVGGVKEYIRIVFIEDDKEDITIYKKDIKSVSTYEEYKNGVEKWRE